jgi:uncharacterized protein (DUF2062 family)
MPDTYTIAQPITFAIVYGCRYTIHKNMMGVYDGNTTDAIIASDIVLTEFYGSIRPLVVIARATT